MISQATLHDIPVIRLMVGENTADICPAFGANILRLKLGRADVYRTPRNMEALKKEPNLYGEPLLFPPNRINHGCFHFDGRDYHFPINEPERGHHIHGYLSSSSFALAKTKEKPDEARVDFTFEATAEAPYLTFPHTFSVARTYILNGDSLFQRTRLKNTSAFSMPAGVGFHTAMNVCFEPSVSSASVRLTLPVREQILVDGQSIIPTGERRATPLSLALNSEGVPPQGVPLSAHFKRTEEMTVRLRDESSGAEIRYEVSPTLAYFMLWNAGGDQGFICPEPQSWIVDAPNQSKEEAHSGFRALAPSEELEVWTRLSTQNIGRH